MKKRDSNRTLPLGRDRGADRRAGCTRRSRCRTASGRRDSPGREDRRRPRRSHRLRRREADGGPAGQRPLPCSRTRHGRQKRRGGTETHPVARVVRAGFGPAVVGRAAAVRGQFRQSGRGEWSVVNCQSRTPARPRPERRRGLRYGPRTTDGGQTRQAASRRHRRLDALPARPRQQRRRPRPPRGYSAVHPVGQRTALGPQSRGTGQHECRGHRRGPHLLHRGRGATGFDPVPGRVEAGRPRCLQRHAAVETPPGRVGGSSASLPLRAGAPAAPVGGRGRPRLRHAEPECAGGGAGRRDRPERARIRRHRVYGRDPRRRWHAVSGRGHLRRKPPRRRTVRARRAGGSRFPVHHSHRSRRRAKPCGRRRSTRTNPSCR